MAAAAKESEMKEILPLPFQIKLRTHLSLFVHLQDVLRPHLLPRWFLDRRVQAENGSGSYLGEKSLSLTQTYLGWRLRNSVISSGKVEESILDQVTIFSPGVVS